MKELSLALVVLVGAELGWAHDACLTGPATLGDQRGIAMLRAAADVACPCAEAPSRGAYQRCARRVLDESIANGTLRRACRATAGRDLRGAVCGSPRIACAQVRSKGKKPVGCRITSPTRCQSARGTERLACADETHCADVVDWTASTCVDVRENGPFGIGVRMVSVVKASVVDPAQERVLDTVVWYPAPADVGSGEVADAPFASGAPFPVVLFSHGSCGYARQSLFLTQVLASYGFIVAAPPHPGNTILELPACGTLAAQVNSALERPEDVRAVLDALLAASADPLSPFAGQIDADRIGMSGHSFGGFTTYRVLAIDPRFKVAVPMAPAVAGTPMLDVPSLLMLGAIDSVVNNAVARAAFDVAAPPKFQVEIQNAGHYAFSDGCFPSPDCAPTTTLTQAEAHDVTLRWVLPFLQRFLAGDESFAPFLTAPPPPGVAVDAQT